MKLADMIQLDLQGEHREVAVIHLTRKAKRNALNDSLLLALRDLFEGLPSGVRAAVLHGEGDHFCAGLDLSELQERDAGQGMHHSRMWHAALEQVQFGPVPVIAALHGAVVGGGLELACACHIRVADESTFYALPEGKHGIFVGGGGSVRIPKLIGTARIAEQPADQGLFTESMMAAIAQSATEAKTRMKSFLDGKSTKVRQASAHRSSGRSGLAPPANADSTRCQPSLHRSL